MPYSSSSGGTCYEKLGWANVTHDQVSNIRTAVGADFSFSNDAEFRTSSWGTRKHATKSSTRTKDQGLDQQAERTTTLTLASCVLPTVAAVLLLLLLLLSPPRLALLQTMFFLEEITRTARIHT